MTSVLPPMCGGCNHLDTSSDLPLLDPKCAAFPAGIPNEILLSKVDHRHPYAGDGDIRFEPQTPADADYAATLFPDETPPATSRKRPRKALVRMPNDWDRMTEAEQDAAAGAIADQLIRELGPKT